MAWTESSIFRAHLSASLEGTAPQAGRWNSGDTFMAALFDQTVTPNKTVAPPATAYGGGVWGAGGVFDPAGWPAAGLPILNTGSGGGFSSAADVVIFDGDDTPSTGLVTLADVHGDLVYNSTAGDLGAAYHWFGGPQQVTNGTFTIIWSTDGIMRVEV